MPGVRLQRIGRREATTNIVRKLKLVLSNFEDKHPSTKLEEPVRNHRKTHRHKKTPRQKNKRKSQKSLQTGGTKRTLPKELVQFEDESKFVKVETTFASHSVLGKASTEDLSATWLLYRNFVKTKKTVATHRTLCQGELEGSN